MCVYDDELCHDTKQSSVFSQFLFFTTLRTNPCESIKTLDECWDAPWTGRGFQLLTNTFRLKRTIWKNGAVPGVFEQVPLVEKNTNKRIRIISRGFQTLRHISKLFLAFVSFYGVGSRTRSFLSLMVSLGLKKLASAVLKPHCSNGDFILRKHYIKWLKRIAAGWWFPRCPKLFPPWPSPTNRLRPYLLLKLLLFFVSR